MSAECEKCGCNLVYGDNYPDFECQYCKLEKEIEKLQAEIDYQKSETKRINDVDGEHIVIARLAIDHLKAEIKTKDETIEKLRECVSCARCEAMDSRELDYKDKIDRLQSDNKKLMECVDYALAQEDQQYGMPEGEAIKFRSRKVFSILEECLSELEEKKQTP